MKQRHQPRVEDWIQEHVNLWYCDETTDEQCFGIHFDIPYLNARIAVGVMFAGQISQSDAASGDGYELQMDVDLKNLVPC